MSEQRPLIDIKALRERVLGGKPVETPLGGGRRKQIVKPKANTPKPQGK